MNRLNSVSRYIQKIASGRVFLVLTLVVFGLGYAITSSVSPSEELMELAHGLNVPDAQFWRSADTLHDQLAEYGDYGIHHYLTRISPIDLFIPLAQVIFICRHNAGVSKDISFTEQLAAS